MPPAGNRSIARSHTLRRKVANSVRVISPDAMANSRCCIVAAIEKLHRKEDDKHLYVLLDGGEGGLLVKGGHIIVHAQPEAWCRPLAVGARDCFLAHVALELAARGQYDVATKLALRAATLCTMEGANALHHAEVRYLHSVTQRFDTEKLASVPVEESPPIERTALALPSLLQDVRKATSPARRRLVSARVSHGE